MPFPLHLGRDNPIPSGAPPLAVEAAARRALTAMILLYALLAGLHTVSDPDLGWMLATGRWIVAHHALPTVDVLSHTAAGQPFLYPVLSALILYGAVVLGGFALLSWMAAAATLFTTALLLRHGTWATLLLALVAVPVVAERTVPRAELFTQILFAAFVAILWHYHRSGRGALFLLPPLMALWANLHPGCIAGLAMCAAYPFMEAGEAFFHGWTGPLIRLRRAALWLVATFAAALLNPFGYRLFSGIFSQGELRPRAGWLNEWLPMRFHSGTLREALSFWQPESSMLWLFLLALISAAAAFYLRRVVPAAMLLAAAYLAANAIRMRGDFAAIVVVLGGTLLAEVFTEVPGMSTLRKRLSPAVATLLLLLPVALIGVRLVDLVSDRLAMRQHPAIRFGAGASTAYPEAAANFVRENHLPPNLFNDYNSGGYLSFALGPQYRDYIDGRGIPFGPELFLRARALLEISLDSPAWRQEADRYGLQTILVSIDPAVGAGALGSLRQWCLSESWRPVYLDGEAAVFVRATTSNAELLRRLAINCDTQALSPVPGVASSRADRFHHDLNSAAIYLVLGRSQQALAAAARAESIYRGNAQLGYFKGLALLQTGQPSAEAELRAAVSAGSPDAALLLASIDAQGGHYEDQVQMLHRAAELSSFPPYSIHLQLGYAELAAGHAGKAMDAFADAEHDAAHVDENELQAAGFWQALAAGRAQAQGGASRR
jgi:hypothetical protein